MTRVFTSRLLIMLIAAAAMLFVPAGALAAPGVAAPTVKVEAFPDFTPMIGSEIKTTVSFKNNDGSQTGYGPFVELLIDTADQESSTTNDGLVLQSIKFAGKPLKTDVFNCDTTIFPAPHPYLKDPATEAEVMIQQTDCPTGKTLVVVHLPFGSFTHEQPEALLDVTFKVSVNFDAKGAAGDGKLGLSARGGYRFGANALDDPSNDPPVVGAFSARSEVTPTVIKVSKAYIGPEHETATGPNYPRSYEIDIDVATGQTVSQLQLLDELPAGIVITGVTPSNDGAVVSGPGSDALTLPLQVAATGNNDLSVSWETTSVTGTAGAVDRSVKIDFWVPYKFANGDELLPSGNDQDFKNPRDGGVVEASGWWVPLDPNDQVTQVTALVDTDPLTSGQQPEPFHGDSIVIQKSFDFAENGDVSPAGLSPTDVLEYTIEGQVSDYYALDNIIIVDKLRDGLKRDTTFAPTIKLNGQQALAERAFDPSHVVDYEDDTKDTITFNVSNELNLGGLLRGGCVPAAGIADPEVTPFPSGACTNGGATTFTITYRAIVQQAYKNSDPVRAGDRIDNTATVTADAYDSNLDNLNQKVGDDTRSSDEIKRGEVTKEIYAINGNTDHNSEAKPGNLITYYVSYDMPFATVKSLVIEDYLPRPVLDAGGIDEILSGKNATIPPVNKIQFFDDGTDKSDTYTFTPGETPTLATHGSSAGNFFQLTYANSGNIQASGKVAFLVTLQISDDPFADELLLTNQVRVTTNNTEDESARVDAYARFTLREPVIEVQKGIANSSSGGAVFTPATTLPTGASVGDAGGAVDVSGITAANASAINSNVTNLDASDTVRYVVTYRNTGGAPAYRVKICDTLPSPTIYNDNVEKFTVTNGAGSLLYTGTSDDYFDCDKGLTIDGPINGREQKPAPAPGSDVIVVVYDQVVTQKAQPAETDIINTAQVSQYENATPGSEFLKKPKIDPATARTSINPSISKEIVDSSAGHTTPHDKPTIGEKIKYEVVVTFREGETRDVVVTDTLPAGLALADPAPTITLGGMLTSTQATLGSSYSPSDNKLTFDLGTVTNSSSNNTDGLEDQITITYWAVVRDVTDNAHDTELDNSVIVKHEDCGVAGKPDCDTATVQAQLEEPSLTLTKGAAKEKTDAPAGSIDIDAGDNTWWTIEVSNAADRPTAFDVKLTDVIPAGLTYVDGTLEISPMIGVTSQSVAGQNIVVDFEKIEHSQKYTIKYQTSINSDDAVAGRLFENNANITAYSLPDTHDSQCVSSATDPDSCKRRDYTNNAKAEALVKMGNPTKTLDSTSAPEAITAGQNVVIGERATYTVRVPVPEGTTQSLSVVDTLDEGLVFTKAAVQKSAESFSNAPDLTGVTPAFSNSGRTMTIAFGDFVNGDNDADIEYIVITYEVQVADLPTNTEGKTLNNDVAVSFLPNGETDPTKTSTVKPLNKPDPLVVRESVVNIDKKLSHEEIDGVSYVKVVVTASSPTTAPVTAYDVVLSDDLSATPLSYVTAPAPSCPVPPAGAYSCTVSGAAGANPTATINQIAPGQTVTWTFYTQVKDSYVVGSSIDNEAEVVWTSLPAPHDSDANNCVDDPDPDGTPAGACQERTKSKKGSVTLASKEPSITKQITGSSLASTSPHSSPTVGERVEYTVAVKIPAGTTRDLSVVDTLDAGLAFATTAPDITRSWAPGSFTPPAPTYATTGDKHKMTLDFGDVTNTAGTDSTITIKYWALVQNVTSMTRDAKGDNSVELRFNKNTTGGSPSSGDTAKGGELTIVEPTLEIDKKIEPLLVDAGKPATITLTIEHTSASNSTAYDVVVTDPLPTKMKVDTDPSNPITCDRACTPLVTTVGTAPNDQIVTVKIDSLAQGETLEVTIPVVLSTGLQPSDSVSNTGHVDWRSQPETDDVACAASAPTGDCGGRSGDYEEPVDPLNYTHSSTAVTAGATSSSIGGRVWHDENNDGVRQPSETCVAPDGVEITLTGTDLLGRKVGPMTAFTGGKAIDANVGDGHETDPDLACGEYRFVNLLPGTYEIVEKQPADGWLDGKDSLGSLSNAASSGHPGEMANDRFHKIELPVGQSTVGKDYDFGEIRPSSLSGRVWGEKDGGPEDGKYNAPGAEGDTLLAGVKITITGTDDLGRAVERTTTTDANGEYRFDNLRPGTYKVTETQPEGWRDPSGGEGSEPGTGLESNGTAKGSNVIDGIEILQDQAGVNYDFWEVIRTNVRIAKTAIEGAPDGVVGRNTTFKWRITVTNDGPSPATNVKFTDDLAALAEPHLQITKIETTSGTTCSAWDPVAAPNLSCTVTALSHKAPGNQAMVELTVLAVSQPAGGEQALHNDVEITGLDQAKGDDSSDNKARDTVRVRDADIGVVKSVDNPSVIIGERVTWSMLVTNHGPGTDPAVIMRDTLPKHATFVSVDTNRGSCVYDPSGIIDCALGQMKSGETALVTVVTVQAEAGTYTNRAAVTSPETDRNPANQTSEATTKVRAPNVDDCTVEGEGRIVGTSEKNNIICGGPEDAVISCGDGGGDIIIITGSGDNRVNCPAPKCDPKGSVTVIGGSGSDVIRVGCPNAVLHGGGGNDIIYGSKYHDVICGDDGNDIIYGLGGNDLIEGGRGNDKIYGGPGNDRLFGGPGNDIIYGGTGNDRIYGGTGNDRLYGGPGNDRIYGGAGHDHIWTGPGNDIAFGEAGNDRIWGGRGRNRVHGGKGNDIFYMKNRSRDSIIGGAGRDTLYRDKRLDRWRGINRLR